MRNGSLWLGLCLALALMWARPSQAAKAPPQAGPPTPGAAAALTETPASQVWGTVRTVLDGMKVAVVTPELRRLEVRLVGVEPPEPPREGHNGTPPSPGQPFGPEAAEFLRDLLLNKQVWLDVYGKDRQGRTLAVVWLGDINVNLTLVKEGLAWVSPSITIPKVRIGLEVALRQAQVGKYGLWALPDPEPPWQFRKRHRLPFE